MKITVDKDQLLWALKRLKAVAGQSAEPALKDILGLTVEDDNVLAVSSMSGLSIATVYLDGVEDFQSGGCQVGFYLLDLAKAAREDTALTLDFNKKLSVRGSSGFKASLAQHLSTALPYEQARNTMLGGSTEWVTVPIEDLKTLVDISKTFPPEKERDRYVLLTANEDGIQAAVQQTEAGTLENYPITGDHSGDLSYCLPTLLLSRMLTFGGENLRIGLAATKKGIVLVDDPQDQSWWGMMGLLIRNTHEG